MPEGKEEPDLIRPDLPDVYAAIKDETLRALEAQFAEISAMRSRLPPYAAFIGTGIGVLVGSALKPDQRPSWFPFAAFGGALTLALMVYLMVMVLLGAGWNLKPTPFATNIPYVSMRDSVAYDVPVPTAPAFHAQMAKSYAACIKHNEPLIASVRKHYVLALSSGSVSLLIWVCTVAGLY